MEFIVSLHSIGLFAYQFWQHCSSRKVFAFTGEMGAGKTTLITELCRNKGVKSTMSSPTFSIINEYATNEGSIFHLDLYRLKDEEEAVQAGVEDVMYSGSICFVEWPERASLLFPADAVWVNVETIDNETRKVTINLNHSEE